MRKAWLAAALTATAIPAQAGLDSVRPVPVEPVAPDCLSGSAPAAAATAERPPVLVEGLGYAGLAPDTQNAQAKRWFEQGVRLVWAYDEAEAVRSFRQAQALDPQCAMCFWGEGWARSPTLNLNPRDEEHGAAKAAAARALALSAKLGERDRGLVAALQARLGQGAKFDNGAYMKAMAALAGRFPAHDAVVVMAADAVMVGSRTAEEGAPAQGLLESVLARNPDHSGAIHYYIHLTDFIDKQRLAERYANRLGKLAPGASHLVHMPSHTFYGVGRYRDAAAVNVAALAAEQAYADRADPAANDYRSGLARHNMNFAIEAALMRGDGRTALDVAERFRKRFPAGETEPRAMARASTWYAAGLHAPVGEVLAMPEPGPGHPLIRAIRHYARGEAFARTGDAGGVKREAAALDAFLKGPASRKLGSKPVELLVGMTRRVLEGRAAMIEGRYKAAAASYREAMRLQDKAGFGMDPPPFWYSARRSLAAALLASGQKESARLHFLQTLRDWPNDPRALFGLAEAEKALGQADAAAKTLARAKSLWAGEADALQLARL
jgi:tetratricopeptide (TPR) repeat protein